MAKTSLKTDPLLQHVPECGGYKILGGVVIYQKLGQGGMGAVYRGKHPRLGVDVAVKVMALAEDVSAAQADNFRARFIREAKTAAAVRHQNLIRVYDVNSESGTQFLIMDYIDGESAGERLQRKGKLSEAEAVEIILGAAVGLAAAHAKGIVHRDVKPDNILVDRDGHVVVVDLGLAKAFGDDQDAGLGRDLSLEATWRMSNRAIGTPYYMSPEQTRSARDVGPPADVWSLGVTLYQLASGALPWDDADLPDLIQKIRNDPLPALPEHGAAFSAGLRAIVEKALQKNPSRRYADCGQMARALRDHLAKKSGGTESVLADPAAGTTKLPLATMAAPGAAVISAIGTSDLSAASQHGPRRDGREATSDLRGEKEAAEAPLLKGAAVQSILRRIGIPVGKPGTPGQRDAVAVGIALERDIITLAQLSEARARRWTTTRGGEAEMVQVLIKLGMITFAQAEDLWREAERRMARRRRVKLGLIAVIPVGIVAIAGVVLEVVQRGLGLHPTILESVLATPPGDLYTAFALLLVCWAFLFLEVLIPSYGLLALVGISSLMWGAHLMWSVATSCGVAYIALWSSLMPGLLIFGVWLAKHIGIILREQRKTPQPDMRPDAMHAGLRLGDRGVARITLHPSGEGEFRGHGVSVTTETAFVDAGAAIEVVAISGYATVVREVGKEEPDDDT